VWWVMRSKSGGGEQSGIEPAEVAEVAEVVQKASAESEGRLKRLTGRALVYVVADTLNRGSAILLIPLYTWFMSPTDYGILALASLINSFLVMLLSFGGASVVIRFYHQYSDEGDRARFLGGFWLFLVIVPGAIIAAALILI